MDGTIRYLRISNFRSIDVLELRDIQPFSVFAGPNGSGKSNFFDALDFVSKLLRFGVEGAEEAVRQYGGIENILCHRRAEGKNRNFEFEIEFIIPYKRVMLNNVFVKYKSELREKTSTEKRRADEFIYSHSYKFETNQKSDYGIDKLATYEANSQLKEISCYRIHPASAKMPSQYNYDLSVLQETGNNLAAVLSRFEKKADEIETISEWLELVVPGFQRLYTNTEPLTGSTVLALQEQGTKKAFPAHLISDGTVYLLCLLAAILPERSFTLIEEPERGLHPKAIQELVKLFREKAGEENRIWLTTHSETVVRGLCNGELWLVDKDANGATQMKKAEIPEGVDLPVDEMWLCNILNGGLPW